MTLSTYLHFDTTILFNPSPRILTRRIIFISVSILLKERLSDRLSLWDFDNEKYGLEHKLHKFEFVLFS